MTTKFYAEPSPPCAQNFNLVKQGYFLTEAGALELYYNTLGCEVKYDIFTNMEEQPIQHTQEINGEKSHIRIRVHKNLERGTELTYATIPIEEARNIDSEEIRKNVEPFYGSEIDINPLDIKRLQRELALFINSDDTEDLFILRKKESPRESWWNDGGYYLSIRKIGDRLVIFPALVIHNILGHGMIGEGADRGLRHYEVREKEGRVPFDDLMSILQDGFHPKQQDANAMAKISRDHRFNSSYSKWDFATAKTGITHGDVFSLEIFPAEHQTTIDKGAIGSSYTGPHKYFFNQQTDEERTQPNVHLEETKPQNVSSVNIQLCADIELEQREEKMKFYREQITKKYGIPVRFFEVVTNQQDEPVLKRIFPGQ